ncbi:MAG: S24 family peptidase [Rikenellaceae bacterium]
MSQNREDCWPRLESVIRWSNMSTNHFARHIGLSRGENLYQIKRGNNGISRKLAEMIVSTFPQINIHWLLTGSGEMQIEELEQSAQIEFYDADIEQEIRRVGILEPKSRLLLPKEIDADFAMIYRGDAMIPSISTNSIIMLKQITTEMIIPGREYLVVTKGISALRIVRYHSPEKLDGMLRLVATNSGQYDDIFIETKQIEQLYKVVAKLIVNN